MYQYIIHNPDSIIHTIIGILIGYIWFRWYNHKRLKRERHSALNAVSFCTTSSHWFSPNGICSQCHKIQPIAIREWLDRNI